MSISDQQPYCYRVYMFGKRSGEVNSFGQDRNIYSIRRKKVIRFSELSIGETFVFDPKDITNTSRLYYKRTQ